MSKAEERAMKAYPIKIAERDGYDENLRERKGFVKGYHKAEKDLELIWEDISDIIEIHEDVLEMESCENVYMEVLRRFKERKEK
jgi:hypothetical protein